MPHRPVRSPRSERPSANDHPPAHRPVLRRAFPLLPVPNGSEEALLQFDVADDLEALVPMPPTIPAPVRGAITRALGERFGLPEELDIWLHTPNTALGGASPFEALVDGAGIEVLAAVVEMVPRVESRTPAVQSPRDRKGSLRLM